MKTVKTFEDKRWKNLCQNSEFRHKAALDFIDKGPILDIGCGDGLFLEMIKNRGIEAKGVDISEEAVKKCKVKGLDCDLRDVENEGLPFGNSFFKYSLMLDVLEHAFFPETFLREAARVSERVIISVPNFNSLPARIQVFLGKVPENNRPNKGHIYWFNFSNLKRIIERTELEIVDRRINTWWEEVFIIGRLLKFLSRFSPNIFALSFVLLLEKKN